jgi:hypothetical protein
MFMEGTARLPGARAAEYQAAHPGTVICQVEGTWYAWIPASSGDPLAGSGAHARGEAELLAKLP